MEVMTVGELIEVLGRQNPTHEVYMLNLDAYGELVDVRVDDGAERVTLIGGDL